MDRWLGEQNSLVQVLKGGASKLRETRSRKCEIVKRLRIEPRVIVRGHMDGG
jgi:hypothetical protein